MSTPAPTPTEPRRLTRNTDDRMVAGMCSGLADYFDLDVTLVRVLTVVATIFSLCGVLLAYLVAWFLVPRAHDGPMSLPHLGSLVSLPCPRPPRAAGSLRRGDTRGLGTRSRGRGRGDRPRTRRHRRPDRGL